MRKELIALRDAMSRAGIDAYVIPTDDFHGSEYVGDYFKCRHVCVGIYWVCRHPGGDQGLGRAVD